MKLTFLSAAVPLTKTIAFSPRDDQYTVSPYPMVSRVTSHVADVNNTSEFAAALREHAALGRCLLKGELDQELIDESRATHSVDQPHEWLCFDFDKVDCAPTMDGALAAIGKYLPPACRTVECVVQLSASCFNPRTTRLSAHVFMLLDEPCTTQDLLDWFGWLNFQQPLLGELRLSDSGNALSWPLDRTVAHGSKLLYIAPPKTVGYTAHIKPADAIKRFTGKKPRLNFGKYTPVPRETMHEKINELRSAAMLPTREFHTLTVRGQEVLKDPGECVFHDLRSSGDGYIRFNINGGDSMAYFINLREPHMIGNFKGEPYMYTREANEAFYKGLVKAVQAMPSNARGSETTDVLAFYGTNRGSAVYIGTYDRVNDVLRVDKSSAEAAFSWMRQFGIPIKPQLPHYDLTFDIKSDIRYEEGYPVINLYARTDFMKEWGSCPRILALDDALSSLAKHAPVLSRTLLSITGDERSALGFLNWLAYIFQKREKAGTAWLLWGVPGTGKGQWLEHVLRPLLGQSSTMQMLMERVDSNFNSLLEGKLLVNIDEAAMTRTRDKVEAMSKIKNWITEPHIVINEKNMIEREVASFVNFIVTSNDTRPIVIEPGDRRFHVASRQETRLQYTPKEYAILVQGEELPELAQILGELIVDEFWVRNPEVTEQKARLYESTHSLVDRVAMAIAEGDTSFFVEARPADIALQTGVGKGLLPIREYDELLRHMLSNKLSVLKKEDLYVLFHVVVNDTRHFSDNPTEQRRVYQRHGLIPAANDSHRDKRTGKSSYGIKAPTWQPLGPGLELIDGQLVHIDDDSAADDGVVTPINARKK